MMNQNSGNIFTNAFRNMSNLTETENGHAAASTTNSAVLDLYGQIGAIRDRDESDILDLFKKAIREDKLLAAKTMFYGRDCRGGTGERKVFRTMLKWAADNEPDIVKKNIALIPEFGRWDDLYAIVGTKAEESMWTFMQNQLIRDIDGHCNGKPISLLAKWMKSPNASSKETRELAKKTWKALEFVNERFYRKCLSELRAYIDIVERKMSAGEWSEIDYEKVPSKAGLIYRKAFKKHDEARYADYISSVEKGEKKINVAMNTPQDLVHAYVGDNPRAFKYNKIAEDPTIEAMWKNQPDYIHSDENVICMVDTSGSMYGRPIEVSTGLGMYFAQKNRGDFHNLFMTFESEPHFVSLVEGDSFLDNLRLTFNAEWGGSTDLNKACEALLQFAKDNNVPQKDMPTRLIVISDMEIDRAVGHYSYVYGRGYHKKTDILHVDELRAMYEQAGYKMPQVIYWNVESRHNHFQTRSDIPGTMLASGSSPRVFEAVMAMKDYEATPYDAMLEVLNGERYSAVQVG